MLTHIIAAMAAAAQTVAAAAAAATATVGPLPPKSCPGRWELGWDYPVAGSLRTHSLLFSVVCLYSILSVAFSPLSRKREISLTATYVHACGCLSYLFMGNAWVPFLHTHDGWPVLVARSLEWCLSVPLFLRMLAQLVADRGADNGPSSATTSLRRDQAKQVLALLLGTLAGPFLLPHPVAWLCYALGCVLQLQVLHRIHTLLAAVRATVKDARDEALLAGVHATTLGLFCVYPVIWYLGVLTHAISPETETVAFAWLDLVSKFAFTSVLCNLTTRTYDLDMVDSAAQFWKFIRVIELPVFAISKERRVIFWNQPMAELTRTDARGVMHRRVEDLVDVFPEDTRASLAHMAVAGASLLGGGAGGGITSSGGVGEGGSKQDVRYEVPLLAGGRKGRPLTATFSVLANHLEEVAIPRVVFVGSHPAEGAGAGGGMGSAPSYDPAYAFARQQQEQQKQQQAQEQEREQQEQRQQRRRGAGGGGGGGVSPSADSEDSYSSYSSSSQSAVAAAARGGRRKAAGGVGRRHVDGGAVAAAGGAPADVYGEGDGGSPAVVMASTMGGVPAPGGADATAFVQLAYSLHSGAVGSSGGSGGGEQQEGRRKEE